MKKAVLLMTLFFVFSCKNDSKPLLGKWKVDSTFYKATYHLKEVEGDLKAEILYYNDDTTVLRQDKENPTYLFQNLRQKDDQFVDAVSGATNTEKHAVSLQLKHKDTLQVTTYILNKPLKEIWIRTQ